MRNKFCILFALAFAYVLSYLLRMVTAVLAPDLKQDLNLSDQQLGFLTSLYFMTFCLAQIPLGPLLDKYGARRVESSLMVLAALGAIIFGFASSYFELIIGRALIGLGVAACLMGAFKVFRERFEISLQGTLSVFILFFGAIGALLSTSPTFILSQTIGWRNLFYGLGFLLFFGAVLIYLWVPNPVLRENPDIKTKPVSQRNAYYQIFSKPVFWQSLPVYLVIIGGSLGLQGLWLGPWFTDTVGLSAKDTATGLFWIALAQLISLGIIGIFFAPWAGRTNRELWVVNFSYLFSMLALGCAVIFPKSFGLFGMIAFISFVSANILNIALVNTTMPPTLVGRASTIGNFFVILGAFGFQWFFGIFAEFLQDQGILRAQAIHYGMMITFILMLLTWIWFLISPYRITPAIGNYFLKRCQ